MRILEIKGKDSAEFLQRLFASTAKIEIGEGARGLFLQGNSRMIAQFDLLRLEKNLFWLASPSECYFFLKENLEKMHFSEEIEFFEGKEFGILKLETDFTKSEPKFSFRKEGEKVLWPSAVPGYLCETRAVGITPEFHFDRIAALVPWPNLDWNQDNTALESGTLPWIDRYKGCYPGQEVVEKSLNVGHPPKILQAFEGDGILASADKLVFESGLEGIVTSVARHNNITRALVRVPWKAKDQIIQGWNKICSHW